jgi:hypothetical protein
MTRATQAVPGARRAVAHVSVRTDAQCDEFRGGRRSRRQRHHPGILFVQPILQCAARQECRNAGGPRTEEDGAFEDLLGIVEQRSTIAIC